MKKVLSLIFFFGAVAVLSAQTTITLRGALLVENGPVAADKLVTVAFIGDTIDNEVFYEEHETLSDNSGMYSQEFVIPEHITDGYLYASITDCNGKYAAGWAYYEVDKAEFSIDLQYCSEPDPVDTSYNIDGYVYGDSSAATTIYRVYLYHENGYWVDSMDTEGYYNFQHPLDGAYAILAMVAPGQENPNNHVPTYYGQTTEWYTAGRAYTPATEPRLYNIYLLTGDEVSGDGSIKGRVTKNGMPVANASILLFDGSGNNPLNSARTDGNGIYFFNVAEGNYKIRVEMFGHMSEFNTVSITSANMQSLHENFVINGKTIQAQDGTGIRGANAPTGSVVLFPNPVQDQVHLEIAATGNDVATVEIFTVTGTKVAERSIDLAAGKNTVEIPAADLAKGFYTVKISGSNGLNTLTFVK